MRRSPWAVPAGVLLVFALLVGLRVHGFSLAMWHQVIDGSEPGEVLLGAPRSIRSDDWKVHLPLALAQRAHDPPFPLVNESIALGQSALVPFELPVAHPLVAFRPTVWGFFLGGDVGVAWLWWSRVLGLFAVWYGVLFVVSAGRADLAGIGALAVTAAPFFQLWSYFQSATIAAAGGGVFLAAASLLRAQSRAGIVASGAGLGFAGACFALATYPPYQVTLAWLVVALLVGRALELRGEAPWRRHPGLRLLAAIAAALVVLAAVAGLYLAARESIETMRQTAYPGARVSTGGGRTLAQLTTANLAAAWWAEGWGPLHNICEAASFWLLAPVPAVLWLVRWARGERVDPVAAALLVYLWLLGAFTVIGAPALVTRATGLSLVPGPRAVIGIGLADTLLVVRWLARAEPLRAEERRLGLGVGLAAGWSALLGAAALELARDLPGAPPLLLGALVVANGGLAWLVLVARRPRWPLAILAAASLAGAIWFHPLTVGGTRWLVENEVSQRILAIDRAEGGRSVWASFGPDEIGNLFRILGVRSISGVHPVPQLELWRRIDPSAAAQEIYNRYAHVNLVARRVAGPPFRLVSRDVLALRLDPGGPGLRALGVTHVLVQGGEASRRRFEEMSGFEPLGSVGNVHLFRVRASGPARNPG